MFRGNTWLRWAVLASVSVYLFYLICGRMFTGLPRAWVIRRLMLESTIAEWDDAELWCPMLQTVTMADLGTMLADGLRHPARFPHPADLVFTTTVGQATFDEAAAAYYVTISAACRRAGLPIAARSSPAMSATSKNAE